MHSIDFDVHFDLGLAGLQPAASCRTDALEYRLVYCLFEICPLLHDKKIKSLLNKRFDCIFK